jgi:hypothetical protein
VTVEKNVHGFVPLTIELLKGVTVPKILVKLPMIQLRNLRKEIAHVLKDQVEIEKYKRSTGKHET